MVNQLGRWLQRRQGIERNPLYRLAQDVATGRMSEEAAYQAVERSSVLNRLADGDLWDLDREVGYIIEDDPRRALILVRLMVLAARYKGFDRVLVDANLRAADLVADLGNDREQELHLREALNSAEKIANVPGQRRVLSRLARLTFDRGDTDRARELLNRQLESGREDVDTLEDIETALLLGDLALNDDDAGAAREFYHRAARSAKRVGHFAAVVDALLRQVMILREAGQNDDAVLLLTQAQDAADRTIDVRLQSEIAIQTAAVYAENHQYQQARTHLINALERVRLAEDVTLESRCLAGLARVEQLSGRRVEAADHYQELSELESRLGNRSAAVRALLNTAELRLEHRQPTEALNALQKARPLVESLDEPELRQGLLGLQGLTYGALNQRGDALDSFMEAVDISRRLNDLDSEGRWLLGTGEVLLQFGEYDDAMAAARRSLAIANSHSDYRLEAQALALVGSINLARGLYRDAEEALQRALIIARQIDDPGEQLAYLQLLAQLGRITGQAPVAIRYLRQALDVAAIFASQETRSRLHGQLARIYGSMNQLKEAEEHYRSSLSAAEEAESAPLMLRAQRGLAMTLDAVENVDGALEGYSRAAEIAEQIGDTRSAAPLFYNIGAILNERGLSDEARRTLNHAVELAMSVGDYNTADAGRELLRWLSQPAQDDEEDAWGEDFVIDEVAASEGSSRLRDLYRE